MFRLAKQQRRTCMTFLLYISSPSLHDYDAKRPIIISSFMVDVNKRQRFSFSFRELRYSPLEFNSWKNRQQLTNYCKRVGIRAMTSEVSRIHFFGDVFAAVAVVPTIWQRRRQWNWKKYYASFQTFSRLFHVAYLLQRGEIRRKMKKLGRVRVQREKVRFITFPFPFSCVS